MYFVQGVPERLLTDRSACPPPLFERRYRLYFGESTPSFPAWLAGLPSGREDMHRQGMA